MPFRGELLRSFMRRTPQPVVVATARGRDEIRGITIGSFASVSLNPPLVSFNIGKQARMHTVALQAETFNIHLIAEEDAHYCNHFAAPNLTGAEQFEAVDHALDETGTPVLADALAVLRCAPVHFIDTADHTLIIAEVAAAEWRREGSPVLYFDGLYRSVGAVVEVRTDEPVPKARA